MWLPMHFAMCVPDIDLEDIQILVDNDPSMIKRGSGGKYHDNSGHLAVMTKDFNLALVERLKVYDPTFGAAKTFPQSTPLHLAAYYSNNVAVIEELIRAYPPALEMKNLGLTEGNKLDLQMPVHYSLLNQTTAVPDIL